MLWEEVQMNGRTEWLFCMFVLDVFLETIQQTELCCWITITLPLCLIISHYLLTGSSPASSSSVLFFSTNHHFTFFILRESGCIVFLTKDGGKNSSALKTKPQNTMKQCWTNINTDLNQKYIKHKTIWLLVSVLKGRIKYCNCVLRYFIVHQSPHRI